MGAHECVEWGVTESCLGDQGHSLQAGPLPTPHVSVSRTPDRAGPLPLLL